MTGLARFLYGICLAYMHTPFLTSSRLSFVIFVITDAFDTLALCCYLCIVYLGGFVGHAGLRVVCLYAMIYKEFF